MQLEIIIKRLMRETLEEFFNEQKLTVKANEISQVLDDLSTQTIENAFVVTADGEITPFSEKDEVKKAKRGRPPKESYTNVEPKLPFETIVEVSSQMQQTEIARQASDEEFITAEIAVEKPLEFLATPQITDEHKILSAQIAHNKYRSRDEKLLLNCLKKYVDPKFHNEQKLLTYVHPQYLTKLGEEIAHAFSDE